MKHIILTALLSLYLAGCSVVGHQGDIEQPSYTVVATLPEDVEIRRYAARVAVETTAQADDPGEARSAAFRLLFAYISGANAANTEIAMTAPVETPGASRKIDMTAPVESRADASGTMTMRFFLPDRFTRDTAPVPTDSRVRLVALPEQTLAVLTFSGSRGPQAVSEKLAELRTILRARDLDAAGDAGAFFYNPPWTLPWFRRNEVAIAIADRR